MFYNVTQYNQANLMIIVIRSYEVFRYAVRFIFPNSQVHISCARFDILYSFQIIRLINYLPKLIQEFLDVNGSMKSTNSLGGTF